MFNGKATVSNGDKTHGCVPLRWSVSGSVIRDHSDRGRSNEPMNPFWTRIHWLIWSTMIRAISDRWSWSGSSQRNAPMESSISSLQWSRRSTLGSICRYMWCQLQIFTRNMKLVSTNDNQKVTRDKLLFITNSIPWTKQKPRKVLRKMNAVWGIQTSLKHDAIETLRTLNDWISSAHCEVYNELLNLLACWVSCIASEKNYSLCPTESKEIWFNITWGSMKKRNWQVKVKVVFDTHDWHYWRQTHPVCTISRYFRESRYFVV